MLYRRVLNPGDELEKTHQLMAIRDKFYNNIREVAEILTAFLWEPKFDAVDILCTSDFGWETLNTKVTELIARAKSDGMIFYGLGVNMQEMRQYGIADSMDICDSKWIWEANDCYEIDDNNIDREKIK